MQIREINEASLTCGVCDSSTRPFVCVNCLAVVHGQKRAQLHALRRKREEVLAKLNSIVADKRQRQEQSKERERQAEALQKARAATCAAQSQLDKARDEADALSAANSVRRARLEKLHAQTQGNRSEMLSNYFPHLIRYQSLTHQHVSSMLLHEQKQKLKQVLDILPLKVEGMVGGMSSGEGSAILSICGLKVPDQLASLLDGRYTPEATSAALGYTLLLLDLLGTYLGGPLLHEGSFQGSTTVVWQQQTFYNRRPVSSSAVLPLYTEDMPQANMLMPTLATKTSTSSWSLGLVRGGGGGSGAGAVAAAASDKGSGAKGGGAGGSSGWDSSHLRKDSDSFDEKGGPLDGSKYAELQAALNMLQRSISCFVRDLVSPVPGVSLPPSWSAMAWLVMLCALYHRDPRIDGLLQAARTLTEVSVAAGSGSGQGRGSVESVGDGGQAYDSASSSQLASVAAGRATQGTATPERHEDDGEEDWEHLVVLPPKPSESDHELEHWTRSMLPQARRRTQQQ